jgi:ATP-dependent DNA helicase RecG
MDLNSSVSKLSFVGPIYQKRLEKLGISTLANLLNHVPHRYLDFSLTSTIRQARPGETLTIKGEVESIKNQYTRSGKKIQVGQISDETGKLLVVWFNQPFLVRVLYPGVKVSLAGTIGWFGRQKALVSPEYEIVTKQNPTLHTGKIIPVYPETNGLSSKWLRGRINEAYKETEKELTEFLPDSVREKYQFVDLQTAYRSVHFPDNLAKAEKGRKRLAFDELLFLHLASAKRKNDWRKNSTSIELGIDETSLNQFVNSLPFHLTLSQEKAVEEILADLEKPYPMNRLLEGDVGSGKTVVAAIGALATFTNGCQTVFMAPTQILAEQHFNTLNTLLQSFKVRIRLVTSDLTKGDVGRTDIFVGTHALIHRKINFDKVGLVVIDEQHRFGVEQRTHLTKKVGKKHFAPNVLTMTATPIPRTVALTLYGDLDLSTLNELPAGRQKITTWIVPPQKRGGAYAWIKSQIAKNKCQIFVVCPLIEESQVETMKQVRAVTAEYLELKKTFKTFTVGLLHGKQAGTDKSKTLDKFRRGQINILVATPVVEVGIDVPNATIMLIEASERFGLAQLHQLRGRVGRGKKKSYCLLFTESRGEAALTRLSAMTKSISGFELAELDLTLRGPGEIFGTKQHGFPELKIASWGDIELIKNTKKVAEDIVQNPRKYPLLRQKLSESLPKA